MNARPPRQSKPVFVLLALATAFAASCSTIPRAPESRTVAARPPAVEGELAEVSKTVSRQYGDHRSGFLLLKGNREALDWRLALVDHARSSIDVQYYIWKADASGALLLGRLLEAAERGVRVRVLVDDFPFAGDDQRIAALCHHPNIEIKIFNPGKVRVGWIAPALEFIVNYGELNRRMHNKAFIVDNRLAIVGGRNIGDDYFGLSETFNFIDLDVLTSGAVVPEISRGFDAFWNSEAAYPGKGLDPSQGPEDTAAVLDSMLANIGGMTAPAERAGFAVRRRDWSRELRSLGRRWHPGTAGYYYDAPVVERGRERERFLEEIPSIVADDAPSEMLVVSPYLIPGEGFLAQVGGLVDRGARVRILVPSLEANDTPIVHSHYRKYRQTLLARGAELYEFRADVKSDVEAIAEAPHQDCDVVGLHLKTFVGDRRTAFIGSLNLDPRSIRINTEGGLRIESPTLAAELAAHVDWLMSDANAWRVSTEGEDGSGALRWESRDQTLTRQPAPGTWSRVLDAIYRLLPVESQL